MQGNEAIAEGTLKAGVRFFDGYPITPSTEFPVGNPKATCEAIKRMHEKISRTE